MPIDAMPEEDFTTVDWQSRGSFTKRVGVYRVCVNFKKQNFWVYGGDLAKRNFTWASCGSPERAWAECKAALSTAGA